MKSLLLISCAALLAFCAPKVTPSQALATAYRTPNSGGCPSSGVEVVADGFREEGEGGGLVGELGFSNVGGDGLLAAEFVEEDGDVWGGIALIGGQETSYLFI